METYFGIIKSNLEKCLYRQIMRKGGGKWIP